MSDKDDKIRIRAHQIWEAEGRPAGRHTEHWQQAEGELADGSAAERASGADGSLHVSAANDPTRPDDASDGSVAVKTGSGHSATTREEREIDAPARSGSGDPGATVGRTTEIRETTVTRPSGRG